MFDLKVIFKLLGVSIPDVDFNFNWIVSSELPVNESGLHLDEGRYRVGHDGGDARFRRKIRKLVRPVDGGLLNLLRVGFYLEGVRDSPLEDAQHIGEHLDFGVVLDRRATRAELEGESEVFRRP